MSMPMRQGGDSKPTMTMKLAHHELHPTVCPSAEFYRQFAVVCRVHHAPCPQTALRLPIGRGSATK